MRSVWLAGLIGLLLLGPAYYVARAHAVADCRHSEVCRVRGDCVPSAGLSCVPGSDDDCLRSGDCRTYGFCSAVGDRCRARLPRDCERLERCQAPRSCTVLYGLCVSVTR